MARESRRRRRPFGFAFMGSVETLERGREGGRAEEREGGSMNVDGEEVKLYRNV